MNEQTQLSPGEVFLGIEAGGTRTVALAVQCGERTSAQDGACQRIELGPANLRLVSNGQLIKLFRGIARAMPKPISIAIGMAGARTDPDRGRITKAAARVWPGVPCFATNDLETALMAGGETRLEVRARVLVLSGTGSCCFGRRHDGRTAKVGGWGHLLGDKGSGYEIGLRALKAVVYYYDCDGVWSRLGQKILRALQLSEPDDLIGWAQTASKSDIARLALEVFNAAAKRERIALDILAGAADSLARDAAACAARLVKPNTPAQFVFAGSVLLKQPGFAQEVGRRLRKLWTKAVITHLQKESAWGAVQLARQLAKTQAHGPCSTVPEIEMRAEVEDQQALTRSLIISPTEQRNPRSMNLDKLSLAAAIKLMLREDQNIPGAILSKAAGIERAIKMTVRAFRRGGRLFYIGAGSSGRLGVLDASECSPTFCAPPEMVQGIMAGGQRALWEAVEGAEDDFGAGGRAIEFRGMGRRDVAIGIAASGRTPFVWGALEEAKRRGAATILLCFNPNLKISHEHRPDLVIAPDVGPEILTGSTRLKAGTATKLILNIITTLSMVRLGKVLGNLMIDVNASNTKLRDRATRIVQELTGADYAGARAALEKANWKIKPAWARLRRK